MSSLRPTVYHSNLRKCRIHEKSLKKSNSPFLLLFFHCFFLVVYLSILFRLFHCDRLVNEDSQHPPAPTTTTTQPKKQQNNGSLALREAWLRVLWSHASRRGPAPINNNLKQAACKWPRTWENWGIAHSEDSSWNNDSGKLGFARMCEEQPSFLAKDRN